MRLCPSAWRCGGCPARGKRCSRIADRSARHRITCPCACASTASARASARWYEMFPRSAGPDPGRERRRSREARRTPAARSPGLGSTCCICRRSIRSAAASARGATTRSRPSPAIPAARGRSARDAGGHTAIHPELGTLDDFDRVPSRAPQRLGLEIALDIAFQCSPDHPVGARAPGVVPAPARRHDQVRREPAEEVPGHLPVRLRVRRLARALGRAARASSRSGSTTACGSSASTTRTPSRSASGNG